MRERTQAARGMNVRVGAVVQLAQRIAGQAIGAALQQDELRRIGLKVLLHFPEGGQELGVAVTGLKANIDLGAAPRAPALFVLRAGTGVLPAAVLVNVREEKPGSSS